MWQSKILNISLSFLISVLLSGCGGPEPESPELVSVSGTVTLAGKPEAGITVLFVPAPETPGNGAVATTDDSGLYQLYDYTGSEGIQPGRYLISFSKYAMPDGSAITGDVQPESVGASQVVPAKYTSHETSGLEATVGDQGGTFDFELQSN